MDRWQLSEQSITDLAEIFVTALGEAAPELMTLDLDGIERGVQRLARPVLGQVVQMIVARQGMTAAEAQPDCPTCSQRMRYVDADRGRTMHGLVGDFRLERVYFTCAACAHGRAPVDDRLGLGPGTLSPALSRVACRLGIEDPFASDSDLLVETLGVAVSKDSVRRVTEDIGAVAEAEHQALVAAARRGETPAMDSGELAPTMLAVEVDGIFVHADNAWHEAKVGVVAPLGPQTRTDPDSKREVLTWGRSSYCVGIEEAEDFWFRTYVEACRRGLGTRELETVVVLGDGAEWIWKSASRFLGINDVEVVEIVDSYHAIEHLWTVANAAFGAGTAEASTWAEPCKRALLEQGPEPILRALVALEGAQSQASEEIRKAIHYFQTNAARMAYPTFVTRRLPIGSGAVESAAKLLVGAREKGPGMRWTQAGAQAVATLRALHRSGRWTAFWHTKPQCRRSRPTVRVPSTTPPLAAAA